MKKDPKHLRICTQGHQYFKSSDCPVCPICENECKPEADFLGILGAPARRALENEGIDSLKKLATYTETDILNLHGIGPSSIPKLKKALKGKGLAFQQK